MLYAIQLLKRAERDLAALPKQDQLRISKRIDALAKQPRPPGATVLKGKLDGHLRIRVGMYRVIYQLKDAEFVVVVVRVAHRRKVYRRR